MTKNNWNELVLTKEEKEILEGILGEFGVNLLWSSSWWEGDCRKYTCYVRNPYKEACDGWGSDLVKKEAKSFFDWYNK